MAQNKPNVTVDELLKENIITQTDLNEYKQSWSFSDSAKWLARAYYLSKWTPTPTPAPVANVPAPVDWVIPIPTPMPETTSWTPGIVNASAPTPWVTTPTWEWMTDLTWTALEWQRATLTSQLNDLPWYVKTTTEEVKKDNEQYIKDLEQGKKDKEKELKEANKRIEEFTKNEEERAKKIMDEQNLKLKEERDMSVRDLEASKAQQKLVDEQNIKNQEIANNVAEQQTAWAFAKLGLSFSSWAIVQAQQVAQNWAYAIANLQSSVVKNQTSIEKDIATLKSDYADLINENINKYWDLVAWYKEKAIERINTMAMNKITSSEDILKEKKRIADDFRKTVMQLEKDMKADQRELASFAVENAEKIRLNSERIKSDEVKKFDWLLSSWQISRLSPNEITAMEDKLGLARWEISWKVNTHISQSIRTELDNIAWKEYYPNNMNDLVNKVQEEMRAWRDYQTALNTIIAREKTTNPEIKKAIDTKNASANAEIELKQYEAETKRMDVLNTIRKTDFEQWIKTNEYIQEFWDTSIWWFNVWDIANYSTDKRWTTNLQCWELVNDYVWKLTWNKWWMWDTYQSKINYIKQVWISNTPVAWWLFVLNTWDNVWHTWIIQEVNNDWTVTVLEANAKWGTAWWPPVINKYSINWMTFSQPIEKNLEWMPMSDLRNIARNTEVANIDKFTASPEWRAQLIDAINTKQNEKNKKNIIANKEEIANNYPDFNDVKRDILESDPNIKDNINRLKTQASWIKSLPDRAFDAIFNWNNIKPWNNAFQSKQSMDTKTIWLKWEQKRDLESIKSTISAIEEALLLPKDRWNDEVLKSVRKKYISPILKEAGIKYDEEDWRFYINWIKNIYLND